MDSEPLKFGLFVSAPVALMLLYGCGVGIRERPPKGVPHDYTMQVYLTGYSFWDNTPPKSRAISHPVIHDLAGGTGTYKDPITVAVGHRIDDGTQTLDFPQGTRFYLPRLEKYAIVEDVCGDGPTPQLIPCHIGHKGAPWIDLYVGGETSRKGAVDDCMALITALQKVVINPRRDYPVVVGSVMDSICEPDGGGT